jgi:glycosyltransferase 2 family protein
MPPQRTPQPRENGALTQAGTGSDTGGQASDPAQRNETTLARGLIAGAGLLIVAFAGLSAIVAAGGVPAWENGVVETATHTPAAIGSPSRAVMELGTRTALPGIALAIYLLTSRWQPAVAIIAAGVAASLLTGITKELVGRERPTDVVVRDTADGFGFPSGHTVIAFAVAAVVTPHVASRWGWRVAVVPLGVAATVGFARLYVGVHYPIDVVGGALGGMGVGWAIAAIPIFRSETPSQHRAASVRRAQNPSG